MRKMVAVTLFCVASTWFGQSSIFAQGGVGNPPPPVNQPTGAFDVAANGTDLAFVKLINQDTDVEVNASFKISNPTAFGVEPKMVVRWEKRNPQNGNWLPLAGGGTWSYGQHQASMTVDIPYSPTLSLQDQQGLSNPNTDYRAVIEIYTSFSAVALDTTYVQF